MMQLDRFLADLESRGWMIARRPEPGLKRGWYRYGLVRDRNAYIAPVTRLPVSNQPWLTTQKMWMVTIAIVIILFACCVFLAFSSELRFTAS
jgi:hypothetical protein